jgi:hypothetical protein
VNCSVIPAAIVGAAGVTAIAVTVFAVTVSPAVPLTPLTVAVTVLMPGVMAVARPEALTVATAVFELVHVAVLVTTAVEPSL